MSISAQQLLDAIPDAAAVIDDAGVIIAVNRTWRGFAADNGCGPTTQPGANYLDICLRSASESPEAATAVKDLKAVMSGASLERDLDYACATPDGVHWFTTRVTAIPNSGGQLLITHLNITRHKMAEQILQDRSRRDPLTGLLHRAALVEQLETLLTTATPVAVVFLDLDGFKPINDVYGHAAGDEVLRRVAARLSEIAEPEAVIGRYGGDEFVVIRPRTDRSEMTALIDELLALLNKPMIVRGTPLSISASIGGCVALGQEAAGDVLHRADLAMYQHKRALSDAR